MAESRLEARNAIDTGSPASHEDEQTGNMASSSASASAMSRKGSGSIRSLFTKFKRTKLHAVDSESMDRGETKQADRSDDHTKSQRKSHEPTSRDHGGFDIQIISDLHLEMGRTGVPPYKYRIPVQADHLALLGDIGWTCKEGMFKWLEAQLRLFKIVFFVAGNHEPYGSTLKDSTRRLNAFSEWVNNNHSLGKFIFLNRTRCDVTSTLTILGCTLWSSLDPDCTEYIETALHDFRQIKSFDIAQYSAQHKKDLQWLNKTVTSIARDEPEREIVIFTHHTPTMEDTSDPRFKNSPSNSAYSTELTEEPCWESGKIKFWAFGHTHWCCNFERKGVRLYANQRGYTNVGEEGYNVKQVVQL